MVSIMGMTAKRLPEQRYRQEKLFQGSENQNAQKPAWEILWELIPDFPHAALQRMFADSQGLFNVRLGSGP